MFYGEKEIDEVIGNKITFKDSKDTIELTDKQKEYLITEEAKTDAELKNLMLEAVASDVLDLLQQHNIKKGDLSAIIETVVSSFNQNFLIAVGKAFGTYQEGKYPMQCQEDITMKDIIQMKDK